MHLSLRPDGGICQFMPIRTRPEKGSINYKTIDGVLKWPANVSNEKGDHACCFWSNIYICQPDKLTPQVTKNCLFCI